VLTGKQVKTPSNFQWDHWDIKINSIGLVRSVTRFKEATAPANDSLFAVLQLALKNGDNYAKTFVPQNDIKIVIGENSFDAADKEYDGKHGQYLLMLCR
jgi:hypothetical protein